jgi:membrane protein implicated in regulation of membrane protease activity
MWMYIGAFLMLAELLLPGFVIFFFGLSAATVALLRFMFGDSFTLMWQLAAFSFFAILYLALLRRLMKKIFAGNMETSPMEFGKESVGRIGRVVEAIEPPKTGRVEIGDAEWTAAADVPIAAGVDVKVVAQDNLTMRVKPL